MLAARRSPCLFVASALLATALAAGEARAQPSNAVLAESLYQTGKELFNRGDYREACPKLAESDRLDPAGGTILMLGVCYERQGKIASAYAAYGEALARATHDARDDREKLAKERLAALEARLPRIVIEVPDGARRLDGLVVKNGAVVVPSVSYGVPLLTDPGHVDVSAEAPGYETYHALAEATEGRTTAVRIEELKRLPAPAPATAPVATHVVPPKPPVERGGSAAVPVAIALGVVGLAGATVGGIFGVAAIRDAHAVRDTCHGAPTCSDMSAVALAQHANTEANVANVALPVGAAALAAGLVVVLVSRSRKSSSPATGLARLMMSTPVWQGSF